MKRGLLLGLCLVLAACFAGLAVWQFERLKWKTSLIERTRARIAAPPAPLPSAKRWTTDLAYTRVVTRGRFDHHRETLVQAVTELGPGWWVMTPLQTGSGVVLINRGFVPAERRDPASRAAGQPGGVVQVTGLLRASEPRGGFLRANDPTAGRWYSRDVTAIARARGLGPGIAPYFIDADGTANPGGYPVGGLTVVRFRNSHLPYALTWLGLCGLSLCGAAIVWRHRRIS